MCPPTRARLGAGFLPVLSMKKKATFSWAEQKSAEAYIDQLYWSKHGVTAEEGITAARKRRTVAPIDPYCSDMDLSDLATRRADLMMDLINELAVPVTLEWINAKLARLEAKPLKYEGKTSHEQQLKIMVSRVCCEHFWRKQVRRAQVQKREAQEIAAGNVCIRAGQLYVSDVTLSRYLQRQASNKAMLENAEIESEDGQVMTLWDAVQTSTANKSIRRGELMTRIRGAEEWATAAGMVGIFTTNTTPSRFHASLFSGGMNPNFQGATPIAGQQWLSNAWSKTRAQIKRDGIKVFGYRVAEPHHDGCPHWHMLLWVSPEQATQLTDLMRAYWLQDGGDEVGAQEHRFNFKVIDQALGGAIAYIGKYIAKNVDDFGSVGTEGHKEHGQQQELIEGGNKAQRATAWASAWGIRQFQPLGQPPVTVWRELRRIDDGMVLGASKALQAAHAAVNKVEGKRADWNAYMQAQGGAMTGRNYQLRLEIDTEEKQGRYGITQVDSPVGVFDVKRPGEVCTSNRKRWAPRGTWTPQTRHAARVGDFGEVRDLYLTPIPPWTRVNNCTHPKYSEAEINRFAHSWQHEKQQSRARGGAPAANLRV
jgi:hypothetical protein